MAQKANKAVAQRRTDEVLRLVLDGAMHHDIVAFVREKEQQSWSAWSVPKNGLPARQTCLSWCRRGSGPGLNDPLLGQRFFFRAKGG
jgi:hypothetical protein